MTSVRDRTGTPMGYAVMTRAVLVAGLASTAGACANEPLNGGQPNFAPMMNLSTPAAAAEVPAAVPAADDLSKKSFAAKVLASRALETVTGLKTDPARLSEHD